MALLAIALIAPVLHGCGSDDTGEAIRDRTATVREQAVPGIERSAFERRDSPPAGVAEHVSWYGGGGPACQGAPYPPKDGPPVILFLKHGHFQMTEQLEIAEKSFEICLFNAGSSPIELRVQRPDGRLVRRPLTFAGLTPSEDVYSTHWVAAPGDPIGRYDVAASLAKTAVKASFQVRRATKPRLLIMGSSRVAPGGSVRFALAGFRPEQRVWLHGYRFETSGHFSYWTSILVGVNQAGEAVHEISTTATPLDTYGLIAGKPSTSDQDRRDDTDSFYIEGPTPPN